MRVLPGNPVHHRNPRNSLALHFVRSAAVGGPSTQLTSHAPLTVMKVKDLMNHLRRHEVEITGS